MDYQQYLKIRRDYPSQVVLPFEDYSLVILHKYRKSRDKDIQIKNQVQSYQAQGLLINGYYENANKSIYVISDKETCLYILKKQSFTIQNKPF